MALILRTPPAAATRVVKNELNRRRRPTGGAPPSSGDGKATQFSQKGVPIYSVNLGQLVESTSSSPYHIGWRYFLPAGDAIVETADVTEPDGEEVIFLGTKRGGEIIPRLGEALTEAERRAELRAGRWEIRVLQVPALSVVAIWLHNVDSTDDDTFFVFPHAKQGGGVAALDASTFWQALVKEAKRRPGGGGLAPR